MLRCVDRNGDETPGGKTVGHRQQIGAPTPKAMAEDDKRRALSEWHQGTSAGWNVGRFRGGDQDVDRLIRRRTRGNKRARCRVEQIERSDLRFQDFIDVRAGNGWVDTVLRKCSGRRQIRDCRGWPARRGRLRIGQRPQLNRCRKDRLRVEHVRHRDMVRSESAGVDHRRQLIPHLLQGRGGDVIDADQLRLSAHRDGIGEADDPRHGAGSDGRPRLVLHAVGDHHGVIRVVLEGPRAKDRRRVRRRGAGGLQRDGRRETGLRHLDRLGDVGRRTDLHGRA